MYPSTTFIIEDRSAIAALPIDGKVSAPLFLQFFSSDKGPEEMGIYYGEEFEVFGSPNFARHGQPLLQAQTLINNGARVLAKRVVASDSTLANTVVLANVKSTPVQKTNAAGELIYVDSTGAEVTTAVDEAGVENKPVMVQKCAIRYSTKSMPGLANDITEVKKLFSELADFADKDETSEKVFPLFVVTDNGRGVSGKKFRIVTNTQGNRNKSYLTYRFDVIEDSALVESTLFTLNPDIVSTTANLSLNSVAKTYLKQVKAYTDDNVMAQFLDTVKSLTGVEDIDNCDVLFGRDKRGNSLDIFKIANDEGDVNLSIPEGLPLAEGSNGSFKNYPLASVDYEKQLIEALNGTFTNDIYDIDNILLDAIIDANYPEKVKAEIEKLIDFRKDAFYFRDLGLDLNDAESILSNAATAMKSCYVGIYSNSYDVIDPYSKKQITVTTGYSLARILPSHFVYSRSNPLAGHLHNFIFDEIIEGTVNYLPKIIPGKDQKEELFAHGINFISYLDGTPVLESQYTSQEDFTGLSFINNVLSIQEVIKAIRIKCPKSRYTFMESDDLVKYEEDIKELLNNYTSKFKSLTFEYAADPTYEQNMTFYAVLYVTFKKFIQAEVFRIVAINSDDVVAAI